MILMVAVTSLLFISIGRLLMVLTTGRSRVLANKIKSVPNIASKIKSEPAAVPIAAEPHRVAAVLRPRILPSSRIMTPAPRNPIPETT